MNRVSHWFPAYIGLGSNLQGPSNQLDDAFGLLASLEKTHLIDRSSLYRSAPFGGVEQPDFVNAAASLLTQLNPQKLLLELQRLEKERGREKGDVRWGPRILDLDLLVYSDQKIESAKLTVPHPGIAERNFVLLPLAEIAPDLWIPGLGRLAGLPVNASEPAISRLN